MSQATKGQEHRHEIRVAIEEDLSQFCPDTKDNLACKIAYKENLTPDTVKYNYLKMLITIRYIVPCGNGKYDLAEKTEKHDSTTNEEESFLEYSKKHPHRKTCKNCDKPILETLTFCSKECTEKYKETHNNEE
jgi:hypothetical protein